MVRGSDQHPLYPAFVALSEPILAAIKGITDRTPGGSARTIVSALASLALLIPLYGLTRDLFDARIARVAVLIFVVLPFPAAVGHDTLSDSLALFAALLALWLGAISLRTTGWKAPGLWSRRRRLGYWPGPRSSSFHVAVALTWVTRRGLLRIPRPQTALVRLSALSLSFLLIVGFYALLKGEVSESSR